MRERASGGSGDCGGGGWWGRAIACPRPAVRKGVHAETRKQGEMLRVWGLSKVSPEFAIDLLINTKDGN